MQHISLEPRQVAKQMGDTSLIFVTIDRKKKTYQFANGGKAFKMHSKWARHLQYFLNRDHAAVLVKEVPSESGKSGSSYEIIHVAAVFDTLDELQEQNKAYWNLLEYCSTLNRKHEHTLTYLYNLRESMMEDRKEHLFFIPALEHIATVCAANVIKLDELSTIVF